MKKKAKSIVVKMKNREIMKNKIFADSIDEWNKKLTENNEITKNKVVVKKKKAKSTVVITKDKIVVKMKNGEITKNKIVVVKKNKVNCCKNEK